MNKIINAGFVAISIVVILFVSVGQANANKTIAFCNKSLSGKWTLEKSWTPGGMRGQETIPPGLVFTISGYVEPSLLNNLWCDDPFQESGHCNYNAWIFLSKDLQYSMYSAARADDGNMFFMDVCAGQEAADAARGAFDPPKLVCDAKNLGMSAHYEASLRNFSSSLPPIYQQISGTTLDMNTKVFDDRCSTEKAPSFQFSFKLTKDYLALFPDHQFTLKFKALSGAFSEDEMKSRSAGSIIGTIFSVLLGNPFMTIAANQASNKGAQSPFGQDFPFVATITNVNPFYQIDDDNGSHFYMSETVDGGMGIFADLWRYIPKLNKLFNADDNVLGAVTNVALSKNDKGEDVYGNVGVKKVTAVLKNSDGVVVSSEDIHNATISQFDRNVGLIIGRKTFIYTKSLPSGFDGAKEAWFELTIEFGQPYERVEEVGGESEIHTYDSVTYTSDKFIPSNLKVVHDVLSHVPMHGERASDSEAAKSQGSESDSKGASDSFSFGTDWAVNLQESSGGNVDVSVSVGMEGAAVQGEAFRLAQIGEGARMVCESDKPEPCISEYDESGKRYLKANISVSSEEVKTLTLQMIRALNGDIKKSDAVAVCDVKSDLPMCAAEAPAESFIGNIKDRLSGLYSAVLGFLVREPESVCGDGDVDEGEECDDGNLTSGDGCSKLCKEEAAVVNVGSEEVEKEEISKEEAVKEETDEGDLGGGGLVLNPPRSSSASSAGTGEESDMVAAGCSLIVPVRR